MSWASRFRVRQYLLGSLWFYPLVAAALGLLAIGSAPGIPRAESAPGPASPAGVLTVHELAYRAAAAAARWST